MKWGSPFPFVTPSNAAGRTWVSRRISSDGWIELLRGGEKRRPIRGPLYRVSPAASSEAVPVPSGAARRQNSRPEWRTRAPDLKELRLVRDSPFSGLGGSDPPQRRADARYWPRCGGGLPVSLAPVQYRSRQRAMSCSRAATVERGWPGGVSGVFLWAALGTTNAAVGSGRSRDCEPAIRAGVAVSGSVGTV
jgi:hypothetical protein